MRWLIGHPGPSFSVADVYEGWTEALRGLGEQVYTFNLDDRLRFFDAALINDDGETDGDGRPLVHKALTRQQAVELAAHEIIKPLWTCWPDIVLLISAFWYPPQLLDMIRGRGHKVILLHTESPYQDGEQLIRAAHADINLLNDPANIGAYRELGPAEYMPHAYRPGVHHPAGPGTARKWDLSFVGTGFPSRVKFFEAMNLDGLDVQLAGPWLDLPPDSPLRDWAMTDHEACVSNDETAEIYRQSRTGINFYRRESEQAHEGEGWAIGPREVEMAACGLWFARDPRPESDELFRALPAYDSPAEAGDLIRWALAHPAARDRAAARARAAIEDRTFQNNARALLRMIGKG